MGRRFARGVVALVLGLGLVGGVAGAAGANPADSSWILSTVRSDGAIATNPDQRLVWPYLSNFAAMGLARTAATDPAAANAGWRWLEWYQAHEDASGVVTDYEAPNGVLQSTGKEDSTDAYAGTFLMAAGDMVDATRDVTRLRNLHTGIAGAVHAIESTQDGDGLTWAKPSWHVKYLMDQAETYAGLVAASRLAALIGDTALSTRAASDATRLRTGVLALWNPSTGAYDWAVHEGGGRHVTDWTVLYPDVMQQTWAVAFGLDGGAHSVALMARLQQAQPSWPNPNATAKFSSGMSKVGYWPVAAWALTAAGMDGRSAAAGIRAAAQGAQLAWPFTSAIAGQLAVADAPPLPKLNPSTNSTTTSTTVRPSTTTTVRSNTSTSWTIVRGRHWRIHLAGATPPNPPSSSPPPYGLAAIAGAVSLILLASRRRGRALRPRPATA